jgi:hypothetical protein
MNLTKLIFGDKETTTLRVLVPAMTTQNAVYTSGATNLYVKQSDQYSTLMSSPSLNLTTVKSAVTGPQGIQGIKGDGIDNYDYDLTQLYSIGKL